MTNALVIVNYNDGRMAAELAQKLAGYDCLEAVIVVDNGSTDDSAEVLAGLEAGKLHVIRTDKNGGYSYAMNAGCRYAVQLLGECRIAISNSDIRPCDNDSLAVLMAYADTYAVVGPVIHQNGDISRGWRLPTARDDIMMNIPVFYRWYEKKHLFYPKELYFGRVSIVETVSGCFFVISSAFYEQMGGFDENVFLYYEENILGAAARKLRKRIAVINDVSVDHIHSATVDKNLNWRGKYDNLKRSQYYYEKEYNHAAEGKLFGLKLTADITRAIYTIAYGRGK